MGGLLFEFPPQVFDRIEVRRITRQLKHGQAVGMRGEERAHGRAGVVTRPILDDEQRCSGVGHDVAKERLIGLARELCSLSLIEERSTKIVNEAHDLIRLPLATGFDFGLLTAFGPGVTQGAPLRETAFIAKQNHGPLRLGPRQQGGPGLCQPRSTRRRKSLGS